MKRIIKSTTLLAILAAGCITSAVWAQQTPASSKIEKAVYDKLISGNDNGFWLLLKEQADLSPAKKIKTKEEKGEFVFKQLTEQAARTQVSLISFLKSKQTPYHPFWIVNAVYIPEASVELALELAAFEEVELVLDNPKLEVEKPIEEKPDATSVKTQSAIEWAITKVNADKVWAMGYKGQGVVIGGQDTGYEWDHPALMEKYRGWDGINATHDYSWHDAIHSGNGGVCGLDSQYPCDDNNHGTHTMGTMVGDDGGGNQIGMAPNAKWIGCRNMDKGTGSPNTYLECFQWFLAPTDLTNKNPMPSKAPHVINNSWGCPSGEGCNNTNWNVMENAINNLRAAGVVVVVSAGNAGSNCGTVRDAPAIFSGSFSVGSTTSADAISSFSSRGPVTVDNSNRIKPNVSAPGSSIRSCIPGGSYSTLSGTSMAGPQVAAAVALVISAKPSLAGMVDSIESILEKTAVKLTTTQTCNGVAPSTWPNNTYGWGRIDLLAAINKVLGTTSSGIYPVNNISVRVYPNPASEKLNVSLSGYCGSKQRLKIFSSTGQLQQVSDLGDGCGESSVEMKNLAPGFYLYSVESGEGVVYGKIQVVM